MVNCMVYEVYLNKAIRRRRRQRRKKRRQKGKGRRMIQALECSLAESLQNISSSLLLGSETVQ